MSVVIFLGTLLILYILWMITVKRGVDNLTCRRSFSCRTAFEGEEAVLEEVVRNDGPYIIPWLRVESYISANIRLGKQDNLDVRNDTFYCSCFTLMPYQQIRRRHHVKFLRRGVYDLGNASLAVGELLGVTRLWKEQQISAPVTVYPRLLDAEELPYPLSQTLGRLITKKQLMHDPFMVRGIRPYQPGDLIRDIHWQATARTDQVQVRVHDKTICPRLLVVVNAQRNDVQWDGYVKDSDVPWVEEAIRLGASMCIHGLRSGLAVGFAANMPQQRQGPSTVILPQEDAAWEESLLESFSKLQGHCSENFITLLESLEGYRDMDILILSRYNSESLQKAAQKLRQCSNGVTFYEMEGGDL